MAEKKEPKTTLAGWAVITATGKVARSFETRATLHEHLPPGPLQERILAHYDDLGKPEDRPHAFVPAELTLDPNKPVERKAIRGRSRRASIQRDARGGDHGR